ncbi:TniQ family protein [Paracoccus seriniphilus]|uniref:TniQ family protein n=1 Tax=Paracoccus seriniphilus TaxID=184748 RepID=UPI0023504ADF|nr:TniQ family protein [Paracoccus seriniphilus]WCR14004.1 TniQ family protein [Paracoccus seriniphilus]
MIRLALTLPLSAYEYPVAYLSRLARRNLAGSVSRFAEDVGIDLSAMARGDEISLNQLRYMAGLEPDAFLFTTIKVASATKCFAGKQVLHRETLTRRDLYVCPCCLKENHAGQDPKWRPIHRLHWQLKHVAACDRHAVRLIAVPQRNDPGSYRDVTARISAHWDEIIRQASREEACPATSLESYLSGRLYRPLGGDWVDQIEIPTLCKAAELLGSLIQHGKRSRFLALTDKQQRQAAEIGFDVFAKGPDRLISTLEKLRRSDPEMVGNQPHPQFGEFQRFLASSKKSLSTNTLPIRQVVREYFVSNFPFKGGSVVLGQVLPERKLHSLNSACIRVKRRLEFFRDMLVADGLATQGAAGQVILTGPLTVESVERLRYQKDRLLFENETAKRLGITVESFRTLVAAGLLRPRTDQSHKQKKTFDFWVEDVDAFKEALCGDLPTLGSSLKNSDWERISKVPVRANCNLAEIFEIIVKEKIKPKGLLNGKSRLDHLVISVSELRAALPKAENPGLPRIPAFRHLGISNATLNWLLEQGYLSSVRCYNSDSRFVIEMVTWKSMADFQGSYVTLAHVSRKTELVPGVIYNRLKSRGVTPVVDEKGLSKFYWRTDVQNPHLYLLPAKPGPRTGKLWSRLSPEDQKTAETAILDMSLLRPALGQVGLSRELQREGVDISGQGVRSVLVRHDLATKDKRKNRANLS